MQNRFFPIIVRASAELRRTIGPDLDEVAGLALRALFKDRRSLEIAHQQIIHRRRHIAFSSWIGTYGDLILELDIGNPNLADRVILEDDLRRSERRNRAVEKEGPRRGQFRRV